MKATSLVVALLMLASSPAWADDNITESAKVLSKSSNKWFVGGGLHVSLLTGRRGRSLLRPTFGWDVRGGYRWDNWGVFAIIDHNIWLETEFGNEVDQGAGNFGIGPEYRYAGGAVSSSIAIGPSVLLFETTLDEPGSVGLFVDIRPFAIRWRPSDTWDHMVIKFEPLTLTIVAPVLSGIPLIEVEHRTAVSLEFDL